MMPKLSGCHIGFCAGVGNTGIPTRSHTLHVAILIFETHTALMDIIVANYPGFAGIIPIFLAFPGFPFFFSLSRFF